MRDFKEGDWLIQVNKYDRIFICEYLPLADTSVFLGKAFADGIFEVMKASDFRRATEEEIAEQIAARMKGEDLTMRWQIIKEKASLMQSYYGMWGGQYQTLQGVFGQMAAQQGQSLNQQLGAQQTQAYMNQINSLNQQIAQSQAAMEVTKILVPNDDERDDQ
jgi:hypothetical protein